MDADRFDALARAVDVDFRGGTRRRFLGVLSGVSLGVLAPLIGFTDTEAKKKKKKKKK